MNKFLITLSMSIFTILTMPAVAQEPYDSIKQIDYQPYYLPNSYMVLNQFNALEGTVFVDVNSEQNGASRYMGSNVADGVKVYAISTWDSLGSYQTFLSNVIQENASSAIIPVRMASDEASYALNIVADVVYLNTSNAENLNQDIGLWFTHLTSTGVIVGDNWNFPEVAYAVASAALNYSLTISVSGTFWTLHR